ncbi:hypothetical protein BGZ74_006331 [Mortierella antarctica]|nr:hypothetical protein BGZ74_006331 [Mortierella antarctica]
MSLMADAADLASVEAVQGTRYVLGVLPELQIYDNYIAPVVYYFEKKDRASPWVVRVALRGVVVAALVPLVALFGFLSMMNITCLCVTGLAMGAMEAGFVAVAMATLVPMTCVGVGCLATVGCGCLLVWLGVKAAVAGVQLVRWMLAG